MLVMIHDANHYWKSAVHRVESEESPLKIRVCRIVHSFRQRFRCRAAAAVRSIVSRSRSENRQFYYCYLFI